MKQFSYPNSQFVTITGGASIGWKMFVYATSTTDLVPIYSDVGQTVETDNPVISDANGFFASFYWTGTIDVSVTDENDVEQDSAEAIQDLVSTILATIISGNITLPAGVASGDGDTITTTLPISADFSDMGVFIVRANAANSGTINTPNLQINSYASRRIKKIGGAALIANDIVSGQNMILIYNLSQDCYYLINHEATFLKRDGTAAMLAALNMATFKIVNLATGTAASDAIRLDQMQHHYGTATGTADAMAVTIATALAYVDGMMVDVNAPSGSWSTVASPTININALGNKSIVDSIGASIGYGDIIGLARLVYVSALGKFVLTNPRFGADSIGKHHYTYSTTASYGTLANNGTLKNRADYPVLWGYVSINADLFVSDATWSGDATKQTMFSSGNGATTFRMPEVRGQSVRAWDDGLSVDPGRAIATQQADQFPAHTHGYTTFINPGAGSGIAGGGGTGTTPATTDPSGTGTEVRVKNVALFTSTRAY